MFNCGLLLAVYLKGRMVINIVFKEDRSTMVRGKVKLSLAKDIIALAWRVTLRFMTGMEGKH